MEDLENTQDFDDYVLPDVYPPDAGKMFSDYEGDKSVAEGGGKSNNDSSHTVYVDITSYRVQRMNVNQLKDKLGKINTYVWYKNIIDERLLTDFK